MIRILDKPKLAYITDEEVYAVIGTYYGYPLAVSLRQTLIKKCPEELSRDAFTIFTEDKYGIPLDNYIRFSTIREMRKNFIKKDFGKKKSGINSNLYGEL